VLKMLFCGRSFQLLSTLGSDDRAEYFYLYIQTVRPRRIVNFPLRRVEIFVLSLLTYVSSVHLCDTRRSCECAVSLFILLEWSFRRKTGTVGTLASQAETGVCMGPSCGDASADVRGITHGKCSRLYMQNPAIWCIAGRKMVRSAAHAALSKHFNKGERPSHASPPRNDRCVL